MSISVTFYSFPRRCVSRLSTLFALLLPLRWPQPPPPPPYTCMEGLHRGTLKGKGSSNSDAGGERAYLLPLLPLFWFDAAAAFTASEEKERDNKKGRGKEGACLGITTFSKKESLEKGEEGSSLFFKKKVE